MQLFLETEKIINENEVVAFTANRTSWHKKYLDLEKKKIKFKLSIEEKSFMDSIEPYRIRKMKDLKFDPNQFINYIKDTSQHFIEILVPEVFYYLMSVKDKVTNSTKIILLFPEDPFPIYKEYFGKQLDLSFIQRFTKELNFFIKNSANEWWRTSKTITGLTYNYSQTRMIWLKLNEDPDVETNYEEIKNYYNTLLDHSAFKPIDLTEREIEHFKLLSFESFYRSELPINYGSEQYKIVSHYFIEHLTLESAKRFVKFHWINGLSLNDAHIYNKIILNIFIAFPLTNSSWINPRIIDTHKLPNDYMEAICPSYTQMFIELINTPNSRKYVFINSLDELIKTKVLNYFTDKLHVKFYETSNLSVKDLSNHRFIFVENFNLLENKTQSECWKIFEKEHFINGFVIFYGQELPQRGWIKEKVSLNRKNIFDYDEKLFSTNVTRIIYFRINELCKVKLDEITKYLVARNKYSTVFSKKTHSNEKINYSPTIKINLSILNNAIETTIHDIVFDFNSIRCWYWLFLNYKNQLGKSVSTTVESPSVHKVIFNFDYNSLRWAVYGLQPKPISADNTKTILYTVIAIEYYKSFGKAIKPRQLVVLSDYYLYSFKQIKYDKLIKVLEKEEDVKRDLGAIYSATIGNPARGLNETLISFIKNRIRTDNYKILPKEKLEEQEIDEKDLLGNIVYDFQVVGFPFEKKLFKDNYIETINSLV